MNKCNIKELAEKVDEITDIKIDRRKPSNKNISVFNEGKEPIYI